MKIEDAVALVTGAGSGIGRATALWLARQGATVAVNDVDRALALESVALIEREGGRALPVPGDVADEGDVRRMTLAARASRDRLDIVINNAGVVEAGAAARDVFPDLAPERWLRVLDVNLRGVLLGTQHAIDAMRSSGGGVIVNVSSMAGVGVGAHPAPVYAASKAAVVRFTAALAPLAQRLGIRVNCVCPDWVDTPMTERTRAALSPDEWRAIVPPVMTRPEEIAEAVGVFISDDGLAGRVMLCVGPKPWPLLEPPKRRA